MTEHDKIIRAEKRYSYFRVAVALAVGIAVAVMLAIYFQRDNQIEGCKRGAKRALIETQFFIGAADKNRKVATVSPTKVEKDANIEAAVKYERNAADMLATFPPAYSLSLEESIDPRNKKAVMDEISDSCDDAYPTPIPNVG